jgi:phage terminase large subunit-like protein
VILSLADQLRGLTDAELVEIFADLTPREIAALRWCWREVWGRPDVREPGSPHLGRGQLPPPGGWTWWANIGGRGSGKTRSCAEWVSEQAQRQGEGFVVHLLAQTPEDGAATMIGGPSGLEAISPPWAGFKFSSSKEGGILEWKNKARGRLFGSTTPRKGRGPACCCMWLDDPAAYTPAGLETYRQLSYGFRERMPDGSEPRGVISSTPSNSDLLEEILRGEDGSRGKAIVYSASAPDDNRSNLAEALVTEHFAGITDPDELARERWGTGRGGGKDGPFAALVFHEAPIRVAFPAMADVAEIAICVDPSDGSGPTHDETGLGAICTRRDRHLVVLEDASGMHDDTSAGRAIFALIDRWQARYPTARIVIIAEINHGRQRVESCIRAAYLEREVEAARKGAAKVRPPPQLVAVTTRDPKGRRAGPVAALYQTGLQHHVAGLGIAKATSGPSQGISLEGQLHDFRDTASKRRRQDDRVDMVLLGSTYLADLLGLNGPPPPSAEARFEGFAKAQERLPVPAWGASPDRDRGPRDV